MDKQLLIFAAMCCVNHNHVNYGPGQPGGLELALTQQEADPLLAVGAIKPKADTDTAAQVDAVDKAAFANERAQALDAVAVAKQELADLLAAKAQAQAELEALSQKAPASAPAPAPKKR